MKKSMILISGVLMQIVLGSIYAWSVIGNALGSEYNLFSWQTQLIYGTGIGVFAFGTIITGRMLSIWGPRRLSLISGGLFITAFGTAALSGGSFLLLWLGLGVLLGMAIAFGYVIPLSTAVAWFPHKKGLVTGLAVMGFGGGAIISAQVFNFFLQQGAPVLSILLPFGLAGGSVMALGSLFQCFPETMTLGRKKGTNENASFYRHGLFWYLAISMFLATLGGLIVIGKVTSLAEYYGYSNLAALALTFLTLGNAGGRLLWGFLMDKWGNKSLLISFVVMTLGFLLLVVGDLHPLLFMTGITLSGLQFGASLVLFAAFTGKNFADGGMAQVYPFIFSFYGLAAIIGPPVGGLVFDLLGSYKVLLLAMSLVPILGGGLVLWGVMPRSAEKIPERAA